MSDFVDRLYKELQTVQEFRFKFSMAKIAFVSGLLGVGAIKLDGPNLTAAWYLAPLVAVLFDLLGMGATVAIYRIGAFLKVRCKCDKEKQWQDFLKKHQPSFSWYAAMGFTAITFLAAVFGVFRGYIFPSISSHILVVKIAWFVVIGGMWCFFRCWERQIKDSFKSIESLEDKRDYSFRWPLCRNR